MPTARTVTVTGYRTAVPSRTAARIAHRPSNRLTTASGRTRKVTTPTGAATSADPRRNRAPAVSGAAAGGALRALGRARRGAGVGTSGVAGSEDGTVPEEPAASLRVGGRRFDRSGPRLGRR